MNRLAKPEQITNADSLCESSTLRQTSNKTALCLSSREIKAGRYLRTRDEKHGHAINYRNRIIPLTCDYSSSRQARNESRTRTSFSKTPHSNYDIVSELRESKCEREPRSKILSFDEICTRKKKLEKRRNGNAAFADENSQR